MSLKDQCATHSRRYALLLLLLGSRLENSAFIRVFVAIDSFILWIHPQFLLDCYTRALQPKKMANWKTILHFLPSRDRIGVVGRADPIIKGFSSQPSELPEGIPQGYRKLKVYLAGEIISSPFILHLLSLNDPKQNVMVLRGLLSSFQPVTGRQKVLLEGRRRTTIFYETDRLIEAAERLGEGWRFDATGIIDQYQHMRQAQPELPGVDMFQLPAPPTPAPEAAQASSSAPSVEGDQPHECSSSAELRDDEAHGEAQANNEISFVFALHAPEALLEDPFAAHLPSIPSAEPHAAVVAEESLPALWAPSLAVPYDEASDDQSWVPSVPSASEGAFIALSLDLPADDDLQQDESEDDGPQNALPAQEPPLPLSDEPAAVMDLDFDWLQFSEFALPPLHGGPLQGNDDAVFVELLLFSQAD